MMIINLFYYWGAQVRALRDQEHAGSQDSPRERAGQEWRADRGTEGTEGTETRENEMGGEARRTKDTGQQVPGQIYKAGAFQSEPGQHQARSVRTRSARTEPEDNKQ